MTISCKNAKNMQTMEHYQLHPLKLKTPQGLSEYQTYRGYPQSKGHILMWYSAINWHWVHKGNGSFFQVKVKYLDLILYICFIQPAHFFRLLCQLHAASFSLRLALTAKTQVNSNFKHPHNASKTTIPCVPTAFKPTFSLLLSSMEDVMTARKFAEVRSKFAGQITKV